MRDAFLGFVPHASGLANYRLVRQLYKGWALVSIAVGGEILSTASLAWQLWRARRSCGPVLPALSCLVGIRLVFWAYTQPANRATDNWSILSTHWETLHQHWDYSHAASAMLTLVAFVALISSAVRDTR